MLQSDDEWLYVCKTLRREEIFSEDDLGRRFHGFRTHVMLQIGCKKRKFVSITA